MASRRFYTSSSGDTWDLVHDGETGRVSVMHRGNIASDGAVVEFDLDAFLPRNRGSAENNELMRLIGSLVEQD